MSERDPTTRRALRFQRAYALALQAFDGDREEASDWFERPSERLGGQTPSDFLATEEGARLVETALTAIHHGLPV